MLHAIVTATAQQLLAIGITENLSHQVYPVTDVDKYDGAYAPCSKLHFSDRYTYIIPTRWLHFVDKDSVGFDRELILNKHLEKAKKDLFTDDKDGAYAEKIKPFIYSAMLEYGDLKAAKAIAQFKKKHKL